MTKEEFEIESEKLIDDIRTFRDCISCNSNVKSKLVYKDGNINMPKYSVVIPTANRSRTFGDSVKSAISQSTNVEYEIVVVDNTDDSSIIDEKLNFIKHLPHCNIKYYVNEKNIGMAGNFNRCFELASAPWVAMLHDDDLLHKDYINNIDICLKKNKNKKIGVIRPRRLNFNNEDNLPKVNRNYNGWMTKISILETLLCGIGPTSANTCGTLINRKAFFESGGYNDRLYPCMDHVIGYQIQKLGYSAYYSHDVMGYYRIAINESAKIETFKGFAKIDTVFRKNMYQDNIFSCIYGKIFEGAHYWDMLYRLKEFSETGLITGLNFSDINFLRINKKCTFRRFILKAVRKAVIFKHSI